MEMKQKQSSSNSHLRGGAAVLFTYLVSLCLTGAVSVTAQTVSSPGAPLPTIYEIFSNNPGTFLTFQTAVDLSGDRLSPLLNTRGEGNFTVLAPSNSAFSHINGKYLDPIWQDYLQALVMYHVVNGTYPSDALVQNARFPTLFADWEVEVTKDDPITVNNGILIGGDMFASNGIVHVIDHLLMPPVMNATILQQVASFSSSRFMDVLSQLDLVYLLSTGGPLTVLIPTDNAFDAVSFNGLTDVALRAIVSRHLIPNIAFAYDLNEGQTRSVTTLQGDNLLLTSAGVGSAKWENTDVLASNGVIHAIDTVLISNSNGDLLVETIPTPSTAPSTHPSVTAAPSILPTISAVPSMVPSISTAPSIVPTTSVAPSAIPSFSAAPSDVPSDTPTVPLPTLLQLVTSNSVLKQFVSSLILTDLDSSLDTRTLTVFAPINDAFSAVPIKLFEPQWSLHLTSLLLYHMVPHSIVTSDLNGNETFTPLYDNNVIEVTSVRPTIELNHQVHVETADTEARNGVMDIIDALLLPDFVTATVIARVASDPDLSQLELLLSSVNLATLTPQHTLESSDAAFTLLAPVNRAFIQVPAAVLLTDLNEEDRAIMLKYHIIDGIITAEQLLVDGATFMTVKGETIFIKSRTVNNNTDVIYEVNRMSRIVKTDVLANNGIIHYVDSVVIPVPPTEAPTDLLTEDQGAFDFNTPFPTNGEPDTIVLTDVSSLMPSDSPSDVPSDMPSLGPSDVPSQVPSSIPSDLPSSLPTASYLPSLSPSESMSPSLAPSDGPSLLPSFSAFPSSVPSNTPSLVPSISASPSYFPSDMPSLLPSASPTMNGRSVMDILQASSRLSTLASLVKTAGLSSYLDTESPITLLAPVNAAFAALPAGFLDSLSPLDASTILKYHVLLGKYLEQDLSEADGELATAEGSNVSVAVNPLRINNETVWLTGNFLARNGVLHLVDTVLTVPSTSAPGCNGMIEAYAAVCCPVENQGFEAFCEDLLSRVNGRRA